VPSISVQPGARVLWCLRRRSADVRCVLVPVVSGVEIQVLQDRDLVLSEVFAEEELGLSWAQTFSQRLKAQGWTEVPG
jgi:hypothetical protein